MGNKVALLALSVLVIAFALIGCGGGGGGSENPVGSTALTGPVADLTGTVRFSGQPLADAGVYLYRSEKALQAGVSSLTSMRGSILAQTKLTDGSYFTKSDSAGRYSFTGVPVGEYTLIAVKDESHQYAQTGVMLGSVTTADALLTPTGKVLGRLQLSSGQPVPAAIVHLEKTSYVAISDANGDFAISHVPAGQSFTLGVVSTMGTLQNSMPVLLAPAEEKQLGNLVLAVPTQQVSNITGAVTAADSSVPASALAGRIVLLTSSDPYPMVALSDSAGNYSLAVKSTGSYNVSVVGGEFAVSPTVQSVTVSALGTSVAVAQPFVLSKPAVVLPPTTQFYTFSGTLNKRSKAFNEADEAGIPVTLTALDSTAIVYSAVTSPTGSFTFSIPAGSYNLAIGGGYAFETTFINPVVISASTSLSSVLWAVPTAVSAQLFTVGGTALKSPFVNGDTNHSGVTVTLTSAGGAASTYTSNTDSVGSFSVRVPAGSYNLSLISSSYRPAAALPGPINVTGNMVLANFNLNPIQAPVVLNTVSGSVNKAAFIEGETGNGGVIITLTSTDASARLYSAVTTVGGAFSFKVDPGTYTLAINSGYKFANAFANPVDASAGNVNISPVIGIVPLAAKMFVLSGNINKVIKKVGELNNGDVTVTLKPEAAILKPQTAVTEPTGYFAFKVPVGSYAIEIGSGYVYVTAPSGYPYQVTADLAISGNIDVRPATTVPATVKGTITPVVADYYTVKIEKTDGTYSHFVNSSTSNGGYVFNDLPAGDFRVVVMPTGNGYYAESAVITLSEGQVITGVNLTANNVLPIISTVSLTTPVIALNGSGFQSLPINVATTKVLVDGNALTRPVFTPDDANEQAMIVTVTPGEHNVVVEKTWTRPGTAQAYKLRSQPKIFTKPLAQPTGLTVNSITDKGASLSWTNAQFSQQSMISVYQGVTNISNSAWFDGNTYKLSGLASNTVYTVYLYNRFGNIESTVVTANFTTRKSGFGSPVSLPLANTNALVASISNGLQVFGFELMNDKIYVGYRETASGLNFAYVNSYDSLGNQLATFTINAFTTNPAICQLEKFDMCAGNNSIYVTYLQDITTVHMVQRLDENLSPAGSAVSLTSLGINALEKVKMEYHGNKLFFSVNDAATPRNYYVYTVNADLSGSATQVYTTSSSVTPQGTTGYWLMTTADENAGDLYIAVALGASASIDNIVIIKKSLSNPTLPGATLATVTVNAMVMEFGMKGSDLILNGSSSPDYFKITSNLGYTTQIEDVSNSLSGFGVDLNGRFWAFSNNGVSKRLVNLVDITVLNSLTVQNFVGFDGDNIRPREFSKLQTIGTPGKFGMLYINQSSQLAVFGYDSSF